MSNRSYASTVAGENGSGSAEQDKKGAQPSSKGSPAEDKRSQSHNNNDQNKENSKHNHNRNRGRNPSPESAKANQANGGAYSAAEYQRSTYHIPNTRPNRKSPSPNGDREDHHILTLLTSESLHNYMTSLRRKYFPSHLNKLDAHITLFHALPGSHLGEIIEDIRDLCEHQSPFTITAEAPPVSPRGKTILVNASSPRYAIQGIQKMLREKWGEWLSEQDSGGMRPHYTLLNKVDDQNEIEEKLKDCKEEFKAKEGQVKGLVLWRYEKGFWKDRKVFEFGKGGQKGN